MAKGRRGYANWQNVRLRAARTHTHRCKEIEDRTKHRVTILTSMPPDGRVNQQSQSPFFRLSAEIRLMIYNMAFNYDDTIGFSTEEDGGPAPYASLLLTCRMIWIEANMLPMALTTHTFNFAHGSVEPIDANGGIRAHLTQLAYLKKTQKEALTMQSFFTNLTPLNRIDLADMVLDINHITLEEWCTKESLAEMLGKRPIYTKCLTLRMRDADWGPLRYQPVDEMDFSWLRHLFKGDYLFFVQSFKLELAIQFDDATLDRDADRAHFVALVERLSQTDGLYADTAPVIRDVDEIEGTYCCATVDWTNYKIWPRRELEERAISYVVKDYILNRKFKQGKRRGGANRSWIEANRHRKKEHRRLQTKQLEDEEKDGGLRKQRLADQQVRLQLKEWERRGSLMTFCNAALT